MYTAEISRPRSGSAHLQPQNRALETSSDGASMEEATNKTNVANQQVHRHGFVGNLIKSFSHALESFKSINSTHNSVKDFLTCSCLSCMPFGRKRTVGNQYRTVIPNHMFANEGPKSQPNRKYMGNKIKTTKYSLFTFLPKNLFEQFHRFANLYFIFVVLLNWFPQIEAFGRELSMIPVVFVLAVTAVKDLYEDRRRYRSDQKINHAGCRIYSTTEERYVKEEWQNAIVGDFIHLSCNEIIPADILLLRSSDPTGVCFVETSNLDGESNLKQRTVVTSFQETQATFLPTNFRSTVECEVPNNQIYRFNGFLLHPDGSREAINRNNLLLRGCEIRNTDFVEGIVVYAGHETKAMLNNSGPRYKRSKLERMMNWDIVWCVVILLVLCFIGALGCGIWLSSFHDLTDVLYLPYDKSNTSATVNPIYEGFINFWSYIIILQVMIPISLYVSIEIVKLGQIFFITQDRQLYHALSNKRIQCRALNIPEELGQIQYVMSDKTGTLTENQMIFRRCAVAGIDYGPAEINSKQEPIAFIPSGDSVKETSKDVVANPLLQKLTAKVCGSMDDLNESPKSTKKQTILDFFVNMALCNTVVVNPHPHKDSMNSSGGIIPQNTSVASTLATNNPSSQDISYPKGFYSPSSPHVGATAAQVNELYVNNLLKPLEPYKPPPEDISYAPPVETPNGYATPIFHTKPVEPDVQSNLSGFRRLSISVPTIITPPHEQEDEKKDGDAQPSDVFESSPDLSKLNALGTKLTPSFNTLPWLRPATLSLGKKLMDLPRLAKQRLPPLGRKSPSTPAISPGYKTPFYEAESPDELALVYASAAYGVRLVKRQTNYVTIEMPNGSLQRFEILYTLPFDSVRKRMSVVIKHPKTGKYILFTKGADSAIMDLLSDEFRENAPGQTYVFKSQEYLNLYASYGLRTLCLAKRDLTDAQFAEWQVQHVEAEMAIDDREQLIFESAVRIERDLHLLGITGIEDRLQDGVAECIAALRQGGIKVWVLTGDKIETAVNIAYACKLFVYGMELIQLSAKNEADTTTLLDHQLERLLHRNADDDEPTSMSSPRDESLGLVVDGRTLAYCLLPKVEEKFIQLVSQCTSVLCCRASPLQKASVVRLVKDKLEVLTLAIGDGANDVSMIQCADVGIGISGQEGMQAVMASDFAMARFRFLQRLLLVHGHWCYDRLARMVCYFFYKNALFVFTLVWFQMYNGFSAQVMIDPLYLMLYNLVFTSLPPLLMGVFDQDAPDVLLMENEFLYSQGSKGLLYRPYSFWLNMLDALWQSLVIFFVPVLVYYDTPISMWSLGFLITFCLVIVNQLHLSMEVKAWTPPMAVSILLSVGIFIIFAICYNALSITCCSPDPPYMVAQQLMSEVVFWFTVLFVCVLSLLPRFILKALSNTLRPSDVLLARLKLREKERKAAEARDTFKIAAYFSKKAKHVSFASPSERKANPNGNVVT